MLIEHCLELGDASNPVLLFLHGVGEGFRNGEIQSRDNLKLHGPPKHFERLAKTEPNHPLVKSFFLVAPQLPDRDTSWLAAIDDVGRIIERLRHKAVYLMGFSKGGRAVFDFAIPLAARAAVAIDAAPAIRDPIDDAHRA